MKKIIFLPLLILIICALIMIYFLQKKESGSEEEAAVLPEQQESTPEYIRYAAAAGMFYPGEEEDLEQTVSAFLEAAEAPEQEGRLRILIAPHAGYQFSGQVAGFSYSALEQDENRAQINRVILIGDSHYERFEGISVFEKGAYDTPLGKVKVDTDFAKELIASSAQISFMASAHQREHSLEVQLPFLHNVLSDFKIVPIMMGDRTRALCQVLSDALKDRLDAQTLVVISTDMSHYPSYEKARYADMRTARAILSGEVGTLEAEISALASEGLPGADTFLCAEGAVKTAMLLAKEIGADKISLLNYANSGDVGGERQRVVGYGAFAFYSQEELALSQPTAFAEGVGESELGKEEQKFLLQVARQTVENFIRFKRVPGFENTFPKLEQKRGVFVTLKKNGRLRGCIGQFEPENSLLKVVSQMAIAAATQDKRFSPVIEDELGDLEYEISVLTTPQAIDDWQKILPGRDGVIIRQGVRSGVFLPQVATDNDWDRETFLSMLCWQKLGSAGSCYLEPANQIYTFQAHVFDEQDLD